ncbi:MAG: TrkH family potassium uptake protein [Bacteroidales bacterium]|nr:TrkH family potassium uptake protein [Bacteroidales bacterium]MCF8332759.1 TrkH family potassium uptake protein [Bacteroidales bacterium]
MNLIQATKLGTLKMIFRQIGGLLIILGYAMAIPLVVSLIYSEFYSATGFLFSGLICYFIGLLLHKNIKTTTEPLNRHALIIAAMGWLSIAVMGALPFIIIAYITPVEVAQQFVPSTADYQSSLFYFRNPLHAFFESMSGFTTTGLTMSVHEPSIGKGLLFYRSLSQWIGGAGFIVLALAVLTQSSGKIAFLLYGTESSGERLRPTIIDTARSIWKIYLGVTLFSFVYLAVGTYLILPEYNLTEIIFNSINHAMTGQATGGFSTFDDSIAGYSSRPMEILHFLPMLLGALSLPFYFKVFYDKEFKQIWKNLQTCSIIISCILGSLLLSWMLSKADILAEPYRDGVFQYISALTGTGWQTSNIHAWDAPSIVFIVMGAMVVGGAAGSTVGGVKIIRVLLLFKGLFWHINSYFFSDNSIKVVKFNEKRFLPDEMNRELAATATFVFIYITFVLIAAFITYYLMGPDYSITDALFESATAQGTVGLSCGITHPGMSPILEITYIIQMWLGRLEIIPVLILFRTIFLGTKPKVE